ncbi:MAG: hypothetical protein ACREI5_03450 [Candidatus Methylomirabilales bacterium]
MSSGRKGRDLDRNANQRERPMVTIVEYSTHKKALNVYPSRIISPPVPSRCCSSSTVQVGEIQNEHGWPFVYQRCAACGFTVRRFAPQDEVLEARRIWRNGGQAIHTPDAA